MRLSMRVPRQEYWNRLPFPFPADLPDPGIEPTSPALWASLMVQLVKNPPAMLQTPVRLLGGEDPLEEG